MKIFTVLLLGLSSLAFGQADAFDAANHADGRCKVFYRYEVQGQKTMQYPDEPTIKELKKLQQKYPSVCYSQTGKFLMQMSVGTTARWQSQRIRTVTTLTDMQVIPVDGTIMDSRGQISNVHGTVTVPSQSITQEVPVTVNHTAQDVSLALFGCIHDCDKKTQNAKTCSDPQVYANAAPLCDMIMAPLHEKLYEHILTKTSNGSMRDAFSGISFRHHANADMEAMIKLMSQTVAPN